MILEIRTYRLRPGTADTFHKVATERSLPMLRDAGIDVVLAAPSEAAEEGNEEYALIRAFPSLEVREAQERAFYGSDAWRDGPRDDILACIEGYHTIVLTVSPEAVDALR